MDILTTHGVALSSASQFLEEGPISIQGEKDPAHYFFFSDVFIVAKGVHPQWVPACIILLQVK